MVAADPIDRVRDRSTAIASVLVTGIWLAALFSGQGWWLPFMLFGYIVLVPLVALLFGDAADLEEWWEPTSTERRDDQSEPTSADEALVTLRERYARGELTDEQFEHKLEQLLETETLEDADRRIPQTERE